MIRALILALAATAIANLADPAWRVRERASACLYHLAPFVVPELLAAERDPDAERARRASFTLRLYYRDHADRLSRLLTDLPPIDCLPEMHSRAGAVQHHLDAAYAGLKQWREYGVCRMI